MPSKCLVFIVIGIYLLGFKQNYNSFYYIRIDIRISTQAINRHAMRPLPRYPTCPATTSCLVYSLCTRVCLFVCLLDLPALRDTWRVDNDLLLIIITARKRSMGHGNASTLLYHSIHRRGSPSGGSSLGGVCIKGGLHQGVCIHASRGDCIWAGLHPGWADHLIGYYGIWSTSAWYTSYWNALLLGNVYGPWSSVRMT